MATEAQIAANRLNAQKSTGPRTPEGKAIASRNSLKHTALARSLLTADPNPTTDETSAELRALCDNYYDELQPVGHLEEMLVDQIVAGLWRIRRARQAEVGEINLSLKAVAPVNRRDKPEEPDFGIGHVESLLKLASSTPGLDIVDLLAVKNSGCEFLLSLLGPARQSFQNGQAGTKQICDSLHNVFGDHAKSLIDPLLRMMEEVNPHLTKPEARE